MKLTTVQMYRSLISRLHPQVILSEKESHRLINTLKASFRHQLDAAHPAPRSTRRETNPASHISQAERHVASILTNPLFSAPPSHNGETDKESRRWNARHPMEIWQECVSHGTASAAIALQCLKSFARLAKSYGNEHESTLAFKQHTPGSKVLRWLWANNLTGQEILVHERSLVRVVLYSLGREGRTDLIYNWINRTSPSLVLEGHSTSLQGLLTRDYCLGAADLSLQRVSGAMRRFLGVTQHISGEKSTVAQTLRTAAQPIANCLVIGEPRSMSPSTLSLVQRFVDTYGHWREAKADPAAVGIARIMIKYHLPGAAQQALAAVEGSLAQFDAAALFEHVGLARLLDEMSPSIMDGGTRSEKRRHLRNLRAVQPLESRLPPHGFASMFEFVKPLMSALEHHLSLDGEAARGT